jgi:hypothetical protein
MKDMPSLQVSVMLNIKQEYVLQVYKQFELATRKGLEVDKAYIYKKELDENARDIFSSLSRNKNQVNDFVLLTENQKVKELYQKLFRQ